MPGGGEERGERQRNDDREVQQDRCGRGTRIAVHHVEDRAIERDDRDQQQVGKGDPRELDRERAPLGIVGEPRRQERHDLRHEDERKHEQQRLHDQEQREDAVSELPCGRIARAAAQMRIGRHECRVERAFGEDGPKMIGQPLRDHERVRQRPGAEDRGHDDVAGEPRKPRQQRKAAEGEDSPQHRLLLQEAAR